MFSIAIKNGDIYAPGGSFATVTGVNKLLQDLRCWILTRMGTNEFQPSYGSLLDGGVEPDGTIVQSPIGSVTSDWSSIESFTASDIQRVCSSYQKEQARRIEEDQETYNKITLIPEEILKSVNSIEFNIVESTKLGVLVSISNVKGEIGTLEIPVNEGQSIA